MLFGNGIIQIPNNQGCRDPGFRHKNGGELGMEIGVSGKINDGSYGDPPLECSKECECDSGGVWKA